MFAVVKTGGKQYCVAENDRIEVAKINEEAGKTVKLDKVMSGNGKDSKIDASGTITAKIVEHKRGDKITVFKKKRRQNYRRTKGHRQDYTVLEIGKLA